jgi:hypothetical protein
MKRAVLFLGSAGAGKSTLVNKLTAPRSDAAVGNSKFEDGTAGATTIPGLEHDMSFIDTVGLDSNNYTSHVTEKFQTDHIDERVLLVLVADVRMARLTSVLSKFARIIGDLVGDKPFFIVWTHCLPGQGLPDGDLAETKKKYPNARMFFDGTQQEIETLKSSFSDVSLFCSVKACVTKPSTAAVAAPAVAPAVKPAAISAPAKAKSEAKVATPLRKPLGLPQILHTMAGFRYKPDYKGGFDAHLQKVLQIKKSDFVQYQQLKLLGDADLKIFVLRCLVISERTEELEKTADLVTTNKPEGAMATFFDLNIAKHHDKVFPNEAKEMATAVGSHGKADVVEALLEYTRSVNGPQTHAYAYAYRYIMVELFKLAGLADVLECTA